MQCNHVIETSKQQCRNRIYASADNIDFCRLHFSVYIAKHPSTTNVVVSNSEDQKNMESLIEFIKGSFK